MRQLATCSFALLLTLTSPPGAIGADPGKAEQQTLDLAAAYILEGMFDESRPVLDSLPDKLKKIPDDEARGYSPEAASARRLALQWALLHETLGPGKHDAFDLLVDVLDGLQCCTDERNPVSSVLWQKVFARYAKREGYPGIGGYVLRRSSNYFGYVLDPKESHEPAERAAAAAQNDEVTREIARLEEGAPGGGSVGASGRGAGSGGSADRVGATIVRLLEAPRIVPFREIPLSPAFKPQEETSSEELLKVFSFPEKFAPVRAERQGDEAVAIGASQDYDPVGELSRGAYWVIRSHDGGRTWGRPIYTGLRIQSPYVVRRLSNAPLLAGDRLQVEVKVEELDTSSITFPPVGLRTKREHEGLLLQIPFADLARDSDADGLTDLAEERLVTDPQSPDTDGDGLLDGNDSLPQVPWSAVMDDGATALGAVLGRISGMKSMAIVHEIPAPGDTLDDFMARAGRATLTGERTTFMVADRQDFRSLLTTRPTVVLTAAELALAEKKFGPIFAYRLPLFVLDHEQRRGFVIWDASWVGGALKLRRSGSEWEVETVSDWIT